MKNQSENLLPIPVSIDQIMYWLPDNYDIVYDIWDERTPLPQKCQITYISVMQNSKKVWTKKFRVSKVIENRRVDDQRNYNFDDIGIEIFFDEESARKALADKIEREKDSLIKLQRKLFGV